MNTPFAKVLGNRFVAIGGLVAVMLALLVLRPGTVLSQSGSISGYGWSDTTGWISLSCSDPGTCTSVTYGLSFDGSGVVSGYAWSDNVGWVSANTADLAGCPASPCTARVQGTDIVGWMKALSADDAESGGWDGWVSLSGTNYGLTQIAGLLSGFAWGDMNIGWVDFSANYQCADTFGYYCAGNVRMYRSLTCTETAIETCTFQCANGACVFPPEGPEVEPEGDIKALPLLIPLGGSTIITWTSQNTASCTVSGTNGDSWTGTSGSETSSPITQTSVWYTLDCEGGAGGLTIQDKVRITTVPAWQET